ncbi:cytochrome P450 [Nonomuraea sp. NPDC050556]|uniref:cytochrome P450 n=1 Tax=Nonomuraea sp. NPDC050556 TaxID=3364369 RepID=UPI0037AF2C29
MSAELFFTDQHEAYRCWREGGGVRKVRFPGAIPLEGWLVTGYADCKAALNDPRLSKDRASERYAEQSGMHEGPGEAMTTHMLNSDPPRHTRLRKLVLKAYTKRRVEALRPRIEAFTDALLDELDGADTVDLLSRFALPLPVAVAFELLIGSQVSHQEDHQVRGNTHDDGPGDGEVSIMTAERMVGHIRAMVAHKQVNPGDDLLSSLLAVQELSPEEITSMAFLLLVAGHQTTVNLIANALYLLLTHPGQLSALRADPGLTSGMIEETLRCESPSGLASLRYTTEPVTIGGTVIPAGEFVQIALLAANRDPAVFADPDRFDITRDNSRHLAFGHGIHHCLGASLARLQAEIAITRLLGRFPGLRLADLPEWQHNPRHRGLLELRVHLR